MPRCRGRPAMKAPEATVPEKVRDAYRRQARSYDRTMSAFSLFGFREWTYRRRAVDALQLQPGATVVEIGCGTGRNFRLLQERIGPSGRLIAVDLTDAMLDQARLLVEAEGWQNVELVCAAAADYEFPPDVDHVLSTFALTYEPRYEAVVAKAAQVLPPNGRFVLLNFRMPDNWLRRFTPLVLWFMRRFEVSMDVIARQPWNALRQYFQNYSYQEGYLGLVCIAVGQKTTAPAE